MTRQYILVPALVLFNVALYAQIPSSYQITGTIQGVENGTKVYLAKPAYETDSTIVQNGAFLFKGTVKDPVESAIYFSAAKNLLNKHKRRILWVENAHIKIAGNISNLPGAKVSGSASNKDYDTYINELYTKGKLLSDDAYDSLKTALTLKYIKDFPNSYKSAQELFFYKQMISFPRVKLLYYSFTDKIKKSSQGSLISDYINQKQLKVGDSASHFIFKDMMTGKVIKLSSYRGKYVLLYFWASWSPSSRVENIRLNAIYDQYKSKGFEIIGIGLDNKAPLQEAIQSDKVKWPNAFYPKGYDSSVANAYGIWSIPQNFLINPEGKIIGIDLKETDNGMLSKKLGEVFN